MIPPLHGTGRKIRVGEDEWPVTVTEAMQQACNDYTWATIINDKHPGEGYDDVAVKALGDLLRGLRAQISEEDDPDLSEHYRLRHIAQWLGCWDVRTGKGKNGWATPVRSTMDIPMIPECKTHGLMRDCPADGSDK